MKAGIIALILILGASHAMVSPEISFNDRLDVGGSIGFTYPTGLAWDGTNYYSINGGNKDPADGRIAVYSKEGIFQKSIETRVDSRGIQYAAGKIYVKDNENRIYELKEDALEPIGEHQLQTPSSKIAISPDGSWMLDHYNGKVVKYAFPGGENIGEIGLNPGLDSYEMGRAFQIATDGYYMYFITGPKVYYYNPAGTLMGTEVLEKGPETTPTLDEWSLSYTNGRIWVYKCVQSGGICADDNWYGYTINVPEIPPEPPQSSGAPGGAGGALGRIVGQAPESAETTEEIAESKTETAKDISATEEKEVTEEQTEEKSVAKEEREPIEEKTRYEAFFAFFLVACLLSIFAFKALKGQGTARSRSQRQGPERSGPKGKSLKGKKSS